MATYTDNYNLIKPSYSEIADVATINTNMNTIDNIMHSSQVSLAPAYDSTQTYNTGDVVMYELLMYKCKENNVTGAWNASKWERTTASATGGGGGGSHNDYYLVNGLVGSSGSYVTTDLIKPLEEGFYYAVINDGGDKYGTIFYYASGSVDVSIPGFVGTLTITSTTAGLTFYGGGFRDIYGTIYKEGYYG